MDTDGIFIFVLMLGFSTFGTAFAFSAVGWWRSAQHARELEAQVGRSPGALNANADAPRLEARLESLEAQLDRLAEGQEFLIRVMTDRRALTPDVVASHQGNDR